MAKFQRWTEPQGLTLLEGWARDGLTDEQIARATELLTKYKQGKQNLESRIVEDELWWELRHWEAVRVDEDSAKVLSSVLPVILENNDYEQTYSDNWWEKLKHGTAAYGIFWDPQKENGLGDISIRPVDLLKLFWEPGITDIQQSRNLFLVELEDVEVLEERYPEHKGRLGGRTVDVKQYLYDDTVDTDGKSVVDWYYKPRAFRITGQDPGSYQFVDLNNAQLKDQPMGQTLLNVCQQMDQMAELLQAYTGVGDRRGGPWPSRI